MIKQMAWNTFKKTGDINSFLELIEVENIEKNIQIDEIEKITKNNFVGNIEEKI